MPQVDHADWRGRVRPIRGPEEFQQIAALRYRVYVEEMGKPYAEADHGARLLADPVDDCSLVLGAFVGTQIVGTVRSTPAVSYQQHATDFDHLGAPSWLDMVSEQELLVCSRLVIDRQTAGSGKLCLALMCAMYYHGRERGIRVCLCSTTPSLVRFFSRFGFRSFGAPFEDLHSGRTQQPLALLLEDMDHLRHVASPFLSDAATRRNPAPDPCWVARLVSPVLP